ncbi:hypothetical protein PIECOFPK_00280 [Mycovorax composti]|uniref:Thiol:disulfide interchange protein DsbD N-terminal domain-containing protein n=2 Tax=Chitinophagaceae TaxID=563835 RepID=A0ABZ2EGG6_9BACT
MKNILLAIVAVFTLTATYAQLKPVSWKFSSKKISDKEYEIHMTATIKNGWHLYSQTQPKGAIAIPTKFVFVNNPLVVLKGNVAEVGKLEKYQDPILKVTANQYSNSVTFVQKVTLKAPAKTNVSGNVTFQTCDDKQCLPPEKVSFNVSLG